MTTPVPVASSIPSTPSAPVVSVAPITAASDLPGTVNAIIDLSHWNTVTSFSAVRSGGITAVVHKATQGLQYVDPTYVSRRTAAMAAGLWWGAYHFGTGDDPVAQAAHFLSTVQPDGKTLLVLDLERNSNGPSMNRLQAEAFVTTVQQKLGRWPMLYTGSWYLNEIMTSSQQTPLSNCPLWIASYQTTPALPAQWKSWTIWQYTDGQHGPQPWTTPGVTNCDRDQFNGTPDDMATFWGVTV